MRKRMAIVLAISLVVPFGNSLAEESGSSFGSAVGKAWDGIKSGSKQAWDGVSEGSSEAWEATKEGSGEAWESTKEGVVKVRKSVGDAISGD